MKLHVAILIAMLGIPLSILASSERGNGGNAIVCHNAQGAIQWIEILDFYERKQFSRAVDFGPNPGLGPKVEYALNRLSRRDPLTGGKLRSRWREILVSQVSWRTIARDEKIYDYGQPAVPARFGCTVEQVIIQRYDAASGRRSFVIDSRLWEALNEDNKAGFLLHEVVYSEALAFNQLDSGCVRDFTSLLSSSAIEKISDSDYRLELESFQFCHFRLGRGLPFDMRVPQ